MPSPITVTATIQDPSSTALTGNAFLRFRLRNFAGFVPQIFGTSILPEIQIDALPTAGGSVSQTLWPNNAISPSTTFYTVELWNQGRITSSGNYIFNANTSLNSAAQLNAPPVPAGFLLVLENNGVLNSSQSTLNLANTDGTVTITDAGSGTLNFSAAGGATLVTTFRATAQNAAITNQVLVASVPVDTIYRISGDAKVSSTDGVSSSLGPIGVTFTHTDGTVCQGTANSGIELGGVSSISGNVAVASNSTDNAGQNGLLTILPYTFRAKAGTAIKFTVQYTSNTPNRMTYEVDIALEKVK